VSRGVGLAVAAGLLAVVVALGVVLTRSDTRTAGTNFVRESGPVKQLSGGRRVCQDGELVPGDTAGVRLFVATRGRPLPPLHVDAESARGMVTAGFLPGGGREGHVTVPLKRVARTTLGSVVCIRARGSSKAVLYGTGGRVRLEWQRPGRESWIALMPTISHRFALGKANPFGGLLLALAALVALAAVGLGASLLVRELRT
jgi:hypothetical protein